MCFRISSCSRRESRLRDIGCGLEVERDSAICVLRNLLNGRVEVVGAVSVFIEELSGGSSRLIKSINTTVREWIVGHAFNSVVLGALIGCILIFVVGRNPRHALMARNIVRGVISPCRGVVVNMQDE